MKETVHILSPPMDPDGSSVSVRHAPLQSLYLAASLKASGYVVEVLDVYSSGAQWKRRLEPVVLNGIWVVVAREYDRPMTASALVHCLRTLHHRFPQARILVAGATPSDGEQLRSEAPGMIEAVFPTLPEWSIPRYLAGETEAVDAIPKTLTLDDLPMPAWEAVGGPAAYNNGAPHRYFKKPYAPVLALRGCPNRCFFCDQDAFGCALPMRVRSPRKVVEEVAYLQARYQVREIQFAEPLFNWKVDWVEEMCDRLKRRTDLVWSCHVRIDALSESLLRKMAGAGCWNILFGVESTDPGVQEAVNKVLDLAHVFKMVQMASEEGIQTTASFVLGLPASTPATVHRTIRDAIDLNPDYAQFFLHKSVTGALRFENDRVLDRLDVRSDEIPGRPYVPEAFDSLQQLEKLQQQAYRSFYLRPEYVWNRGRALLQPGQVRRLLNGVVRLGKLLR